MKYIVFMTFLAAATICTAQENENKATVAPIQQGLVETSATVAKMKEKPTIKKRTASPNAIEKTKHFAERRQKLQYTDVTLKKVQSTRSNTHQEKKETLQLEKSKNLVKITSSVKKMKPKKN